MNCTTVRQLVNAYADDELDLVTAGQVAQHLQECRRCQAALDTVQAIKVAVANPVLYSKTPPELSARVRAATRVQSSTAALGCVPPKSEAIAETISTFGRTQPGAAVLQDLSRRGRGRMRVVSRWWPTMGIAAAVLLAVALVAMLTVRRPDPIIAQVLTAHLRSLQPAHLMDVVSTDQHTVKPWFDTHVDFSPPVRQLAPDFPLAGGRLDYLQDRPIAALVYQRGQHVINLFIWPGESGQGQSDQRGFHLLHWSADGMTFWAISDLNAQELDRFAQLFRAGASSTTSPN